MIVRWEHKLVALRLPRLTSCHRRAVRFISMQYSMLIRRALVHCAREDVAQCAHIYSAWSGQCKSPSIHPTTHQRCYFHLEKVESCLICLGVAFICFCVHAAAIHACYYSVIMLEFQFIFNACQWPHTQQRRPQCAYSKIAFFCLENIVLSIQKSTLNFNQL